MSGRERWRPVIGYEESYEVSDLGRVRSLKRRTTAKGGILRGYVDRKGYRRVCLTGDAEKQYHVHLLVLFAFSGPRPTEQQARHLNGDPADNRSANLAWGTAMENTKDKAKHGTILFGDDAPNRVLSCALVRQMRAEHSAGESRASIARRHGIAERTAGAAINGTTWGHVS